MFTMRKFVAEIDNAMKTNSLEIMKSVAIGYIQTAILNGDLIIAESDSIIAEKDTTKMV